MKNEVEKGYKKITEYKGKLVLICTITIVLLALILGVYFKGYSSAKDKYVPQISKLKSELNDRVSTYTNAAEVNVSVLNKKIQSIGELSTIEYFYTDVNKFSHNHKLFNKINLPGTQKSFIVKWNGMIKAGINVEKITVELSQKEKEIIIHLPKAEITSHEIDEKSYELLDEKNNIFNPISPEDSNKVEKESKALMEERALENGILEKASTNSQNIISELINTDAVKEQGYSIVYK